MIELLVVIAIIAILAAILFPVFTKAREKSQQADCLNNQRQISYSILIYAQDHDEMLPDSGSVWSVANLPPQSLKCKTAKLTNPNSYAYNTGASGMPLGEIANESEFFLIADGKSSTNIATFESDLDERHTGKLVAAFADGHVELRKAAGLLGTAPASAKKYIWVAGRNTSYQLGINAVTPANVTVPTQVIIAPTDSMTIAAGATHIFDINSAGNTWVWGAQANGQMGIGTTTAVTMPTDKGNFNAKALYPNGAITYMVQNDGTIKSAGINTNGQLGIGSTTQQTAWATVTGYTNPLSIGVSPTHAVIVKQDNTAWGTGINSNRQLADNSTTQRTAPVQVLSAVGVGFTGVKAVTCGSLNTYFIKPVSSLDTVWSCGIAANGQLGNGTTTPIPTFPVQVRTNAPPTAATYLTDVKEIAAGTSHCLALKNDGSVWAWGLNSSGQLGDGTTTQRTFAVPVSGLGAGSGVVAIRTLYTSSFAIKNDGTVMAWGLNTYGQLGDGSTTLRNAPVPVSITKVIDVRPMQEATVFLTTE